MSIAAASARIADAVAVLGTAVDAARPLGPWGGALLAAIGVAALTVATRSRRPLAVLGGAAVGALAAFALRGAIAALVGVSPALGVALGAAAGGVACGAYPAAFPIAAGALPGLLLGRTVPLAGSSLLGAVAGGLIGGVVGAGFARVVAAVFASAVGATLLAVGSAVALGGRPFARELAGRPVVLAAIVVVFAIAGAAFQLARRQPSPGSPSPLLVPGDRRRF